MVERMELFSTLFAKEKRKIGSFILITPVHYWIRKVAKLKMYFPNALALPKWEMFLNFRGVCLTSDQLITKSNIMEVRKLSSSDIDKFIKLIRVFEDVFEMENFVMPNKEHLSHVLAKPDFFVFVAMDKGEIIGGLTVYTLQQYYSVKPLAYIYDLAVLSSFQRQGVGSKLIAEVNKHCHENGYEEVFVQADKVDDYAVDFYRSTKPTAEEDVFHFSYELNVR